MDGHVAGEQKGGLEEGVRCRGGCGGLLGRRRGDVFLAGLGWIAPFVAQDDSVMKSPNPG